MGQTALHLCTPDAPARKFRRGDARRQADRDLLLELNSVKASLEDRQKLELRIAEQASRSGERAMLAKVLRFLSQRQHHDAVDDLIAHEARLIDRERAFA